MTDAYVWILQRKNSYSRNLMRGYVLAFSSSCGSIAPLFLSFRQ